jgi:sarcosine oxidase
MRRTFPRAAGREHLLKTCLYTLPPDRDFVLDRLPGHERVLLAVGAGHAFKFATQIGRILSELALAGATAHDISLFRADRQVLSDPGAPRTWNV